MKSIASLLLLAAACTTEPNAPVGEQVTSFVEHREFPLGYWAQVDVLFVVDSSPAMAAAQGKLVADYRSMIATLAMAPGGGTPDMHVGVITADLADGAQLRGGYLADATRFNWRLESNHTEPLADAFVARATVGASGSSDTRPLAAMQRALSENVNPTMWRDDAYLAVVFLTAGDDRGSEDVGAVASWLKSIKRDPTKVLVTGAFGACSEGGITATAAPRLAAFVDQFPNRSTSTTLCAPDLSPLTALVRQLYRATLGIACFERLAEPHECDARLRDPETGDEILFRPCTSADDTRCYRLEPHPGCPDEGSIALVPRPWHTPFSATAVLECVAQSP